MRGCKQHRGHEVVDVHRVADPHAAVDERHSRRQELTDDLAAVDTCVRPVDDGRLDDGDGQPRRVAERHALRVALRNCVWVAALAGR